MIDEDGHGARRSEVFSHCERRAAVHQSVRVGSGFKKCANRFGVIVLHCPRKRRIPAAVIFGSIGISSPGDEGAQSGSPWPSPSDSSFGSAPA